MITEYQYVLETIKTRKPGWDTQAAAIAVKYIYGDIETFIRCALPILEKKATRLVPKLEEI
jgi:hypothetical protein